jgi:hypothetical protein
MADTFEPKKENRFIVKFGKPFFIPEYVINQTARPSFKKTNSGMKWDNMVFTMYDPITPSTSQSLMDGLRVLRTHDSQIIDVVIQIMDPVGTIVEEWKVTGEINSIDFGKLYWKSDEALMINVYFDVHYAVLNY